MACKVALYNVIDKLIANKPYISFNKEHGVIDVKNSVTNRINNNNRAAITYSFANQLNKKIKDLIKDKTLGDILYVNWENNVPYILVGPTDRQLNIINNQLSNNTSEVVKKDFEKEKFLRETALRQKRANEYIDDVGDVYPTLQDAIAASNRKEIENNVNNFITLEEAEQVIKDLYPEITPYFDITGKPNFKEDKDVFNQKEDNVQNQRNENNRIIGQADIKAGTVLIDMLRRKKDTIPHEYAHHYIAWFRNAPIVQEAIKKWGSEETLVQAIGEQAVKQKGEAWDWWTKFKQWIGTLFENLSGKQKEELAQILTDAFLSRADLETGGTLTSERINELRKRASKGIYNQKLEELKSKPDFQINSIQQSLNKPNTNPILQGNQQEQVKKFAELQERLNNKEFLEGAKNAFESSEELQNVYYEVLGVNRNNIISSNYLFEQIIKNPENEDLKKIAQLLNKSNIRNRQILLKDYDSVSPTYGQAIGFIEDKKIATNVAVTDFEYLSNLTTNEFDKEFFKNQSFQETLLHEELHRYTSYLLQVYNHYFEQTKNETDAIKELKNYFENVLDKPNLEKEIEFIKEYNVLYKIYQENGGTFNNREFITYGLTNSQEIKKLKSIKVGKDNLLDRMIKALFNLFSTPTLYDALYDTFYNYYLNFDSTKYKEFTDTVKLKLTPLNKNSYSITPQQKQDALNAYTDYIARVSLGIIKNPSSGEYNYESKVKDIVYHFSNTTIEIPDKNKFSLSANINRRKGFFGINKKVNPGINFANVEGTISHAMLFNMKNPDNGDFSVIPPIVAKDDSKDSAIIKQKGDINYYAVFEPEQIHILGSKQDIEGFKNWVDEFNRKNKLFQESGSLSTISKSKIDNLQSTIEYQILNEEKDGDIYKKVGQSYIFLSEKDAQRFTNLIERNKEFPKEFKVTKKITKYERDNKNPLKFNSYNEYVDYYYIKSNKNKKSNLYDIVDKGTGELIASKVRVLSVSKDVKSEIAQKYGLARIPTKIFNANRSIAFALYRQKPSKAKYIAQAKKYLYDAIKFLNPDETGNYKFNLNKIEELLSSFPEEMWDYVNTTYSPEDSTNINASISLQNKIKFDLPKLGLIQELEKITGLKLLGTSFKNYDRSGSLAKVFKFSKLNGEWGSTITIDNSMTTKELKASIRYYLSTKKIFKQTSEEENVRKYAEHRGIDYNELKELVFGDIDKALDNIAYNNSGNSDTIELSKWRESIRTYDWQTAELFSKPYENFQNTVKERIQDKFKDKNLSNGISHLEYFFNSGAFNWLNINFNNISGQYYLADMETEANVGVETKMGGIINPFEMKIYQKPKAGENFLQEKEVFNRLAAILHEPFHALHALSYGTKEELELRKAFDNLYNTTFGKEMMNQVFGSGYNKGQQVSYDTLYKEFTAFTAQLMLYPKQWIKNTDLRSNDIYEFIEKIQTLQDKTYDEIVKTQQKIGTTEKTITQEEQIKLSFLEKLYNYLVKALNKIIPLSKKFTNLIADSKLVEKQVIEDVFGEVEETVVKTLKLPENVKKSKDEFLEAMNELQSAINTLMQIDGKLFSSENVTNFFTSDKFNQETNSLSDFITQKSQEYINATGKQDIEGFKEFVNRQNNTTPLVNVNIDLENKPITKNDIINSDVFHELITQMVSNNEINKNCK